MSYFTFLVPEPFLLSLGIELYGIDARWAPTYAGMLYQCEIM